MEEKNTINIGQSTSKAVQIQTKNTTVTGEDKYNDIISSLLSKINRGEQSSDPKNVFEGNKPVAIVKFNIDKETFATVFKLTTTVEKINECLVDVLELDGGVFTMEMNGNKVTKSQTLSDIGVRPGSKVMFQLVPSEGKQGKGQIIAKIRENIPTLDVITVNLGEAGDHNDIVVEIENQCTAKYWLGGFRNLRTGLEYHNASTQTAPRRQQVTALSETGEVVQLLYHRDTQTPFKLKDVTVDTVVNKATQMWRTDLYITSHTDKIITPGSYQNYEDCYAYSNKIKEIVTIQRAVKSWIHGRKILELLKLQKNLIEDMKKQKLQILKGQEDKDREIITGAAYPEKRDDFYTLYLMVGNWWKREWKRICDMRTREPKQEQSVALLEQEVQLLRDIEKHKIAGKEEALKKSKMRFLNQISRPLMIKTSRGNMVAIEDKHTERARDFKEIYSALIKNYTSPEHRIEFLLTFKELFTSHYMSYEYAEDLVALVNREMDLLTIGTKLTDLKGLHKRIEQLFMHFLQQEEFNPKAAKYKQPNWPKTLDKLFRCTRCHKDLPASKYPVHVRMSAYMVCKSCAWLNNIGHQRVDMSPHLKMLKLVQNSEMEKCCYTAVCFILQPIGMGYLTNIIWHGHSAISECYDLSKLQHIRWLSYVEWAPWNTILLTNQEAKCHASIPNVFEFYSPSFVEYVRQKHILARLRFIPLLKMDHDIRTSGVWAGVKDSGQFQHPSHMEELAADEEHEVF